MKKKLLAVALLSAFSITTFAENMYGSISVGKATSVDTTSGGITASGTSYSMMLGYEVNKYLAAEIGYTSQFSNAPFTGTPSGLTAGQTFAGTATSSGEQIAAVGMWPVTDQLGIFYRVGYAMMSSSLSFTVTGTSGGSAFTAAINHPSTTTSGFVYGPGVKYSLGKDFDVRAGYNIYNLIGSDSQTTTITQGGVTGAPTTITGLNGDSISTEIYLSGAYHF